MVLSKKTHDHKKADQETQSPVIKVFKDMMQLSDNLTNSEKANLLREKREKKKKRYVQKAQPVVKSEDTSASERHYNQVQHQNSSSHPKSQSVVCIFRSDEKRDSSWWAWVGVGQPGPSKDKDDTSSGVSCALKNILTQRPGIMSCLFVFLAVAGVLVICGLVCDMSKSTPAKTSSSLKSGPADGKKSGKVKGYHDRLIWGDSKSKLTNGLSDLYDADFGESSLHTGNFQDSSKLSRNTELANVLDPALFSEGYGSNRLRTFYKKLIQMDMQIKNLKKSIRETRLTNPLDYGVFRSKRSLKGTSRRARSSRNLTAADREAFRKLHLFFPPAPVIHVHEPRALKVKRFVNGSAPTGFVIENKKLVVKFKRPKYHRAQSRLHQRMHVARPQYYQPYYPRHRNAELDDNMNKAMEKNVPGAIFDPFALRMYTAAPVPPKKHPHDDLFSSEQSYNLLRDRAKNKPAYHPPLKSSTPLLEYDKRMEETPTIAEEVPATTDNLLDTQAKKQLDMILRVPNIRRLMQVEVEEESDEFVSNDGEGVKRRRLGLNKESLNSDIEVDSKYHPSTIHNPNWKGPMPLYPDELNMVKPASVENVPKIAVPVNKDNSEDHAKGMSDTEYVEDYFNNKYDKLVKMAQAYSDYGVLEDKKEMRNEKSNKALENRVKMSVQKGLGLLERLSKFKSDAAVDPEGIRIEYMPARKVNPKDNKSKMTASEFFKFGSHFKLASSVPDEKNREHYSENPKCFEYIYTPPNNMKYPKDHEVPNDEKDTSLVSRHKRSLLSINENNTYTVEVETVQDDDRNELSITEPNAVGNSDNAVKVIDDSSTDSNGLLTLTTSFINETTIPMNLERNLTANSKVFFTNRTNVNSSNSNSIEVVGDFFGLMISWVKELAGFEKEDYVNDNETSMLLEFLTMVDPGNMPSIIVPVDYDIENLNKTTTGNPLYNYSESDTFYNVGHRSRVLMTIEEKSDNATGNNDEKDEKRSKVKVADQESTNATTEINKMSNASTVDANIDDKETTENKTIKKRSASNSNAMFWNDIYDDEYGVKDPINALKNKNDAAFKEGSRSENWFGVKLKKIADNLRNQKKGKKQPIDLRDRPKQIFRRNTRSDGGAGLPGDKINFEELTANMKLICREAAQAVQQTKAVEVPAASPDGQASALMQQLVGLMSDLVEIQVQQKTCVPLPPDLRTFLIWLTSPNTEEDNAPMQPFDDITTEPSIDTLRDTTASEPPIDTLRDTTVSDIYPADVRTECLGTIHEVEDLIQLYDEMSEEDKSKMSGVREYLENQLDFLHKQLSTFDGYNESSMFPIRIRRRRQPEQKKHRKLNRFLKSFGRKRTRSTASFDTFTDNRQTSKREEVGYTIGDEKNENDKMKRNLPDVYYRALANATTTLSSISDGS